MYTVNDIISDGFLNDDAIIVNDIRTMIKWLNKQKNLLLFIPSRFSFVVSIAEADKKMILRDALQHDAYKLIELRKKLCPQYETYLCTVLEEQFIVFRDSGDQLEIADVVSVDQCPTYCHLMSLVI